MNTDRTRSGLTRHAFIHTTTVAIGGLSLGACGGEEGDEGGAGAGGTPSPRPLRILILGGTNFIGPHQVRTAVERGHEVTLFNRGRTNPDLFPQLETLIGDRDGDLGALAGREWDVVIDNPANIPRWVRLSAAWPQDVAPRVSVGAPPVSAASARVRQPHACWRSPCGPSWRCVTGIVPIGKILSVLHAEFSRSGKLWPGYCTIFPDR